MSAPYFVLIRDFKNAYNHRLRLVESARELVLFGTMYGFHVALIGSSARLPALLELCLLRDYDVPRLRSHDQHAKQETSEIVGAKYSPSRAESQTLNFCTLFTLTKSVLRKEKGG